MARYKGLKMPSFLYKAIDNTGKSLKGRIQAENEKDALSLLKSKELVVTKISATANKSIGSPFGKGVPIRQKIIFTRQLAVMLKAGLPLVQGLNALEEQTENQNLKKIIGDITQDIKGGTPLSEALEKYPNAFPNLYVNVVKSGEKSGKLEEVLQNLADQLEKDFDLVSRVKSAMVYPIVVLVALIGVIFLITFFIMPQLTTVFAEMGNELPMSTKFLLSFSTIMRQYFLIVFLVFIGLFLTLRRIFRTPAGQVIAEKIKLRVPVFGTLIKKLYMARFTRTMAMLIGAGLPMLEVISTSAEVINSALYRNSLLKIVKDVENGLPLSKVIKHDKNFPPMIHHMLNIGEQSGNLDYVLNQLANYFEKDVDNLTRNLSSLLEPMLMVIMGVGVGFVVISVLGPIQNLANSM
jgi:type IV pilus assembly protein PilC